MTDNRNESRQLLDELDSLKDLLELEEEDFPADLATVPGETALPEPSDAAVDDPLGDGDTAAQSPDEVWPLDDLAEEDIPTLSDSADDDTQALLDDMDSDIPTLSEGEDAIPILDDVIDGSGDHQVSEQPGLFDQPPNRADLEALADLLLERRLAELRPLLREEILGELARRTGLTLDD